MDKMANVVTAGRLLVVNLVTAALFTLFPHLS